MGIENLKTTLINPKTNTSLTLKTPIIGASGTYGYVDEYEDFIDLNCLGAISTKGITLEKRPGNSGNRIFEVEGGMINRIGLENVGIQGFLMDKLPKLRKNNNITQEQLADLIGVSRQAVSKWESGLSIPDMEKIIELCKIFDCQIDEL